MLIQHTDAKREPHIAVKFRGNRSAISWRERRRSIPNLAFFSAGKEGRFLGQRRPNTRFKRNEEGERI